jgi:hypothetical protein
LGLLAAVGLVMVLFGLGAYYATDGLSPFSLANLVGGAGLLLGAGFLQGRRITGFRGELSRRVALRWSAILAGAAAAVVAANVAASGWTALLDMTALGSASEGLYELSPQTLDSLREIDEEEGEPIAILLFTDAPRAGEARLLLRAYRAASQRLGIVELRFAEAPPRAAPFIAYEPTVLACRGDRCEPVGYPSEGDITTALIRLLAPERVRAYFLLGHGEVDLADETDGGYAALRGALEREGIDPLGWVGPAREEAPEDADVVIAGSPERDLLPAEIDALDRYLDGGGRLLVLLEPGIRSNLEELLERWGFGLPAGVVADRATSPLLEDPRAVSLVVNRFSPDHPITRRFSPRTMLLLPAARAVRAERKPDPGDRLREIAYSSPEGWLEEDVEAALRGDAVTADAKEIQGGELPVAAAGSYPRDGREARIVVIGDRDFPSNRLLHALYNRDLLLNALQWLTERDERITVRDKAWTPRQDPLTIEETLSFFYFFAFALPEVLLLLGLHAWWRQRS